MSVTIVRRYSTANGWIGEIYIDGRQIGVSCDNLRSYNGQLRQLWPWNVIGNETTQIRYGQFVSRAPFGCCLINSIDGKDGKAVISQLMDAVRGHTAKLIVLDRLWIES